MSAITPFITLFSARRKPVTVLAVSSLLALAGCGADTSPAGVEARIAPVARVELEGAPTSDAPVPTDALSASGASAEAVATTQETHSASPQGGGEAVYAKVCKTCHDIGLAGAPRKGDKAAWAPRIATGKEALYHTALNGKNAMPAKGGNGSLSDDEVKSAVDFLIATGS
jgi:cytochrome c5